MLLLNAFSISMLATDLGHQVDINFEEITPIRARALLQGRLQSAVGHEPTAAIFGSILGMPVPVNRVNVTLTSKVTAVVGQYSGPRLPEGATTLPEGAEIRWFMVRLCKHFDQYGNVYPHDDNDIE